MPHPNAIGGEPPACGLVSCEPPSCGLVSGGLLLGVLMSGVLRQAAAAT